MAWYDYVMWFFGGAFGANCIPHIVRGITGAKFPTPFAKPPGRGASSSSVNVLWGAVNLAVSYALLHWSGFSISSPTAALLAFVGFTVMGLVLSKAFEPFEG